MTKTAEKPPRGRGGPETARLRWPRTVAGLTAEQVDFAALAHVLGNACRWGGRTARFYSVAQRAVLASREIEALAGPGARRRTALSALLAAARAAWPGDVRAGGPLSARAAERVRRDGAAVDRAVRGAAGLDREPTPEEAELLRFVERMLDAAERRDFPEAGFDAADGAAFPPIRRRIRPLRPDRAARAWLKRFRELAAPLPADGAAGESEAGPDAAARPPADRNGRTADNTDNTDNTENGEKNDVVETFAD